MLACLRTVIEKERGAVTSASPAVLKRYVALELKRLRESAGLSRDQVAKRLSRVSSHVAHLETGRNLPSAADLEVMLGFYGVADRVSAFRELLDAARRGRDWWLAFKGASPGWFDLYLGMESSAVQIESCDMVCVPGLFQTRRYAKAVMQAGEPTLAEGGLERRIDLRMARQDVLMRQPTPPVVRSVLDEGVLRRGAATPKMLAEQLVHLVKLSDLPTVTIQIVPLDGPMHAGIDGSFILLTFPTDMDGGSAVVYEETRFRGTYYEDPAEVLAYRETFTDVGLAALTPEESRAMLVRRIEELQA